MNAYEYALKVEKDGEQYYRELSSKSQYASLKLIFNILANEEVKHYNVIKKMMSQSDIDVNKLDISLDTTTIFSGLKAEKDKVSFNSDEIKFYEEAIAKEDGVQEFYLEKAKESTNEVEKGLFTILAAEEGKHAVILQNILDFVQEPANFVESAEF